MRKRFLWVVVCLAISASCREDAVTRATKPSGTVDPFTQFEALSFKTFDDLRAAGNLGVDFDANRYKLTPSSKFTSLYSAYQDALAFERTWRKTKPTMDRFNTYMTMVGTFSPRVAHSPEKGIYQKIFNPGYSRMINKYGLVIVGGDLYFFDEEAFVRIPRTEVLKWNLSSLDLSNIKTLIDMSKSVPYPVTSKKVSVGNRTDSHQDCATQIITQESGDWGNGLQRVVGCVTINQYSSPYYELQYVCNYGGGGGGEIITDGDGNPMYCSWQNVYLYDVVDRYDARAEYYGLQDLFLFGFPVSTFAYDLTMLKLEVYAGPFWGPSLLNTTTITNGSVATWYSLGPSEFPAGTTGVVQAKVYIWDLTTWSFNSYPTVPAIVNTVSFF